MAGLLVTFTRRNGWKLQEDSEEEPNEDFRVVGGHKTKISIRERRRIRQHACFKAASRPLKAWSDGQDLGCCGLEGFQNQSMHMVLVPALARARAPPIVWCLRTVQGALGLADFFHCWSHRGLHWFAPRPL